MQLVLTLKKEWFDLISEGVKLEEYRDLKPYWIKRLLPKSYHSSTENDMWLRGSYPTKYPFTSVLFKNGYGKDAPSCEFEFLGLYVGFPVHKWIDKANENKILFVIKLGKKIWQ